MLTILPIIVVGIGASWAVRDPAASTLESAAQPILVETAKVVTEDAFTAPRGETEVELFYEFGIVDSEFTSGTNRLDRPDLEFSSAALAVTHGFLERLDARLTIRGLNLRTDESGMLVDEVGNLTLNLKWRCFESRNGGVSLAWLPGLTAPLGPAGGEYDLTTILPNFWSLDNLVVFTLVEKRFNLSLDGGVALPLRSARGKRETIAVADIAVGYQVSTWFQPLLELNYAYNFIQGPEASASILSLTLGAIFNVNHHLRFDLGIANGVVGRNADEVTAVSTNVAVMF